MTEQTETAAFGAGATVYHCPWCRSSTWHTASGVCEWEDRHENTAKHPCGQPACGVSRACCRSDCPISMTMDGWKGEWEWRRKDGLQLMRSYTPDEMAGAKEWARKFGEEAAAKTIARNRTVIND